MSEKITIEFESLEDLNELAGLLGQLPYGQVFQILDKIGKQAGPQVKAITEARAKFKAPEPESAEDK